MDQRGEKFHCEGLDGCCHLDANRIALVADGHRNGIASKAKVPHELMRAVCNRVGCENEIVNKRPRAERRDAREFQSEVWREALLTGARKDPSERLA